MNKTGPGRLILTGANTYGDPAGYSAYTTVNQGVLQADRGVGLPTNSGLVLNGGVFQSNSAVTFNDPFWMWAPTGKEIIWNSGGFSAGGGKMTVNLFGDGRTINWGTDGAQGIAGTMILSSSSAQYETEIQNGIDLNGGVHTIQVDDNPNSTGDFATLSGVISDSVGGGSWTKTGVGTLYIKGAASNTYTGTTTFTGGTVYLAKTGGAIAIPGNITIADGSARTYIILGGNNEIASSSVFSSVTPIYWGDLELNGYQQTLGGISSDAWATISNSGSTDSTLTVNNDGNYTYAGKLLDRINAATGKLSLVKGGAGTLTLTGGNTGGYTGGLTVNSGTLDYSSGALPACNYTLNGGTLNIGALTKSIGTFSLLGGTLNGSGTLTSNVAYDIRSGTVNAVLAGSIGLTKNSNNTATVNAPIYTGTTTVVAGQLNFTGALPSGAYAVSGGVLNTNALSQSIAAFQITGGTLSGTGALTSSSAYDIQGGTVNAVLAGTVGLNKTTPYVATVNAPTYTGTTNVSAGTLNFTGALPSGAYAISGGVLNTNALSQSIAGFQITGGTLSGTGALTSSSAYDIQGGTVNAILAGSVGLNKTGTGTAILTNANTYSGATSVSAGTLSLARANSYSGGTTISGGSVVSAAPAPWAAAASISPPAERHLRSAPPPAALRASAAMARAGP